MKLLAWLAVPVLLGVVVGLGGMVQWDRTSAALIRRLSDDAGRSGAGPAVTLAGVDELPAPVARYLRLVLSDGVPVPAVLRVRQEGTFLVAPEANRWGPFTADEYFSIEPPGFVWAARIGMAPLVSVRVRDGFVAGEGSMRAAVLGLFTVANSAGTPEIREAALHRYLAETAWFPAALLPGAGVTWTALDDSTARGTITAGAATVWLDFHFGGDGLLQRVSTPARGRDVAGRSVPTPWEGRFARYARHAGMLIPEEGEVAWRIEGTLQPYWRGRIVGVEEYRPDR
ncbi:MAG: DUF6544 family protein [Gemmatimonadales bacterium]